MHRALLHRGLTLGLLLLAGCGRSPPSKFPDGDTALDRMHATYSCSRGVKGEAEIDYFDRDGRVRGNLLYIVVLPEQLRFDVYSPFGVILSTLTSNGEEFQLYDLEHKQFLHGPASTCNVARFTQVPVPPFAMVQLLRGEAPVLVHEPDDISIRYKRRRYVVKIRSKHDAAQEIHLVPHRADFEKPFEQQRVRVTRVEVSQGGVPLYVADLRGHRAGRTANKIEDPDGLGPGTPPSGPPCRAEIPDRVRLSVPDTRQELVFDNQRIGKDVVHNPPLVGGVFEQEVPGGVKVMYAECAETSP